VVAPQRIGNSVPTSPFRLPVLDTVSAHVAELPEGVVGGIRLADYLCMEACKVNDAPPRSRVCRAVQRTDALPRWARG